MIQKWVSSPQFSQNSQSFQGLCPWTLPGGLTAPPGPPAEFRKTHDFCKTVVDKSTWEYPCIQTMKNFLCLNHISSESATPMLVNLVFLNVPDNYVDCLLECI